MLDTAISEYTKALESEPPDYPGFQVQAYHARASAYFKKRERIKAQEDIVRAIDTSIKIGDKFAQEGSPEVAAHSYGEAQRLAAPNAAELPLDRKYFGLRITAECGSK
jgi:hypothetical protein